MEKKKSFTRGLLSVLTASILATSCMVPTAAAPTYSTAKESENTKNAQSAADGITNEDQSTDLNEEFSWNKEAREEAKACYEITDWATLLKNTDFSFSSDTNSLFGDGVEGKAKDLSPWITKNSDVFTNACKQKWTSQYDAPGKKYDISDYTELLKALMQVIWYDTDYAKYGHYKGKLLLERLIKTNRFKTVISDKENAKIIAALQKSDKNYTNDVSKKRDVWIVAYLLGKSLDRAGFPSATDYKSAQLKAAILNTEWPGEGGKNSIPSYMDEYGTNGSGKNLKEYIKKYYPKRKGIADPSELIKNYYTVTSTAGTASQQKIIDYASQFIGNPYVWGGTSLTNGCDCSGFVMMIYKHFGYSLPHSSASDRSVGKEVKGWRNGSGGINTSVLRNGDIVCYNGHVGLACKKDGKWVLLNASNSAPYPRGGIKYNSPINYKTILAVRRLVDN